MERLTRRDAKVLGRARYFTGTPCKHGHVVERLTSNGTCIKCLSRTVTAWQKRNVDKVRKYQAVSTTRRDKTKRREASARYARKNPDKVRQAQKAAHEKHPETRRESGKRWRKNNPEKVRAYASAYRALKLQRTPPWADLNAIQYVYDQAPPGTEVDHVIPLQGKRVSGLHVHTNLQVLNMSANRKKSNKFFLEVR